MLEWLILGGLGVLAAGCGYLYEQSSRLKVSPARTFCPVGKASAPCASLRSPRQVLRAGQPPAGRDRPGPEAGSRLLYRGSGEPGDLRGGKEAALALMERAGRPLPGGRGVRKPRGGGRPGGMFGKGTGGPGGAGAGEPGDELELKGQTVWILGCRNGGSHREHIAERVKSWGKSPGCGCC